MNLVNITYEEITNRHYLVVVDWMYPNIGTSGDNIDKLRIEICRVRAINALLIGFDGERDGWVIYSNPGFNEDDEPIYKEVAFVPEKLFEEMGN